MNAAVVTDFARQLPIQSRQDPDASTLRRSETIGFRQDRGIRCDCQPYTVGQCPGYKILTRTQEISGAYVRSFVFKNWNPFVEAGPAGLIFLPIVNSGTTTLDTKQQTEVGAMYGAGFAYEISPSFDIRGEYRGWVTKVPTFGQSQFTTNRWYNISVPTLGVAYHF